MTVPIHLQPAAELAERVLLPGDPGRAFRLAQALLEGPKVFNLNRGLWGYTGIAADGLPITIQSTGMGGPSAAIVVAELADLGAQRLVRVGTCGALHPSLGLGELLIARESLAQDGTSRALGAGASAAATPALVAALAAAGNGAVSAGTIVSTDLFYDADEDQEQRWLAAGALAVEMEAAALFTLAARRRLAAAAVLIVSDILLPTRRRIEAQPLLAAELRLGALAADALLASG